MARRNVSATVSVSAPTNWSPSPSLTPTSWRAPSLQNNNLPARSKTSTASALTSSRPTSCSDNVRRVTASVWSAAVPTQPVGRDDASRTGSMCNEIQRVSPSAPSNRNSWVKATPSWRVCSHASSAAARSAGAAFTHGADPTTTGAPPRTRARNASLTATSRPSGSVSQTATGREASTRSIPSVLHPISGGWRIAVRVSRSVD